MESNNQAQMINFNNPDCEPKIVKKWRKIVRVILIVFMLSLLTLSYAFLFSGADIYGLTSANAVGVIREENFTDCKFGDLIIIKDVKKIKNISVDDIIVYKINGVVYSKKVTEINSSTKIITVIDDEVEKNISFSVVLGVQEKNIAVFGIIWGFLASEFGVIILSILFLSYVLYITISRINYEDTRKGVQLLRLYQIQKKENRFRRKLIKDFKKNDGFSPEDSEIIDGPISGNLMELMTYTDSEKKGSVTDIYQHILEKVYKVYMFKENLGRGDRARISNVIELSPIVDKFDENITFRLSDLILREPLFDFDDLGFSKLGVKFLYKSITEDDIFNFGSVIYVLITKNPKLKKSTVVKLVSKYLKKVKEINSTNQNIIDLSCKLYNLFKNNSEIKKLKLK